MSLPTTPPPRAATGTRLILLGTGGGPAPSVARSFPAQVLLVDEVAYLIDCGNGVARQLVRAGVPLRALRHVFITHHHSDHNADYGTLFVLAWGPRAGGLTTPVDTWGPPPLVAMTGAFLELHAYDIGVRSASHADKPSLAALIRPHEIREDGLVLEDERVRVTAVRVPHANVEPNFAYRFDTADRAIVISGDTARSDRLIALAQGADVLVHEVIHPAAMSAGAMSPAQVARLATFHTTLDEVGEVATAAGVKTLVLSHLGPPDPQLVTDAMWRAGAQATFTGEVVVGSDLLEI
jgi:ribonuclease BN (tRNA processing enzyme)